MREASVAVLQSTISCVHETSSPSAPANETPKLRRLAPPVAESGTATSTATVSEAAAATITEPCIGNPGHARSLLRVHVSLRSDSSGWDRA